MKNMMKEYLGNEYSENHLRNFCLYWMKGMDNRDGYESDDEWRMANDLDCLYYDGDLYADTLMSAWTPIKWVADCLNSDVGIKFYKKSRDSEDPAHDLKLLAEDGDLYLNPEHRLVGLLNRFLELAEHRCNFILLPSREMNPARYRSIIRGKAVWLCDEVPSTLAHIYDKDSLGRFFLGDDGEVDEALVSEWICREHLEAGFELGMISRDSILPLIEGQDPYEPVWPTKEDDIAEALEYMIDLLEIRRDLMADGEGASDCAPHTPGTVSYAASARGELRISAAIDSAFRGIMENESPEDVAQIEFVIKSDFPTTVCSEIDRCIRRLCKWYGRDRMIPYGYSYELDPDQADICRAGAMLHLRNSHRLLPYRRRKKENATGETVLTRPEGITSNALWEIYKMLKTREGICLWVNPDGNSYGKCRLYTVIDAAIDHGETDYGVDNMGIELPWSRNEWIDLTLVPCDSGSIFKTRITTEALHECCDPVEALLARNHMKLA